MERCARRTMPDGRTCARRRLRRTPCWPLLLLLVAGAASTGCSFVYTRGPQPEVQPPPPCTTSNASPTADTALAVVSVGAVVAGSILYSQATKSNCSSGIADISCNIEQGAGIGAIIAGGVGTLVFVPSAIVGYNRTADCRAWLQANPEYVPQPAPSTSSSLLVPTHTCPSRGDAPLLCSSGASRESSALVLKASSGGRP